MKRKNKIKIPRYVNGGLLSNIDLNKLTVGAQVAGTGMQAAGGAVGDVGSVLGDTASLAGTGMAIGGPVGAAVGGGLGLVKGIAGIFSRNNAKKKAETRAINKQSQAFAEATTQSMMDDYYGQNQLANTFAMGGIMPTSPAYLDNGELVKTPDGRINEVTGNPNVQDGVLANLPGGTKILSDKLKVPGTNKTFAQMGRGLQKKSKNNDAFANTAAELNARNFDRLLAYQESVKAAQGIKPKSKSIGAYAGGGITRDRWAELLKTNADPNKMFYSQNEAVTNTAQLANNQQYSVPTATTDLIKDNPLMARNYRFDNGAKQVNAFSTNNYGVTATSNSGDTPSNNDSEKKKNKFDFNSLTSLAPTLYNVVESFKAPETETVTMNPYLGNINSAMASRRANVTPVLDANRRSRAITNYNLSQMSPNTGASLAARNLYAVGEYGSNAAVYSAKQNADNAYIGEQAQMLGNLGNQYVTNQMTVNDLNARNKAARRAYGSAAMTQLGKWGQTQQLMKNTANMDAMMMPFLMENMSQGYTSDLITNMRKQFYGY